MLNIIHVKRYLIMLMVIFCKILLNLKICSKSYKPLTVHAREAGKRTSFNRLLKGLVGGS